MTAVRVHSCGRSRQGRDENREGFFRLSVMLLIFERLMGRLGLLYLLLSYAVYVGLCLSDLPACLFFCLSLPSACLLWLCV